MGHGGQASFSARPGNLPSLGEDVEHGAQSAGGGAARQGGPRFAGNAAFQSAIARHSANNNQQAGHQRQPSLQDRFAEMGYGSTAADGEETMTEDGASSVADFMGSRQFDPTRNFLNRQSQNTGAFDSHRRTESDLSAFAGAHRMGGHAPSASLGGANVYAENLALQQQIEMLQLQQQQLLQQSLNLGSPGLPQPGRGGGRMGAHRRIQSHAPQSGPMGSFSTGGMGSMGMGSFGGGGLGQQQQQGQQQQASQQVGSNLPRGHGRRHSVNVVNKNAAAAQASAPGNGEEGSLMQPNVDFTFPPNTPQQQQLIQQSAHSPSAGRALGHFSTPSVQLSSLSPEYLMAGGGLVNLSSLSMGNISELADGFGGGGAGMGPGGRHGRTGSQNWRINGNPGQQQPVVTDLAQAQAQLASLNQFRSAQAGAAPGHGKTPSFGGGFNPAMMSGFPGGIPGMPPQPQGGPAQRKALFGSYLPQASLPPLLAAGKIVVGMLRVNKRNRSDAYVTTEVLQSDIFISGSKDRNRALDGDVVAVELLDPTEVWSVKKEKEDKKKRKEEQGAHVSRKPDKAKDDLEVEGSQLKLIEDEEEHDDGAPPALAGHVVAIIERAPSKLFSGTIGLLRPSSAATKEKQQAERAAREGGDGTQGQMDSPQSRPKIIWFRPSDKRCPLVAIPADQAPADFWDDQEAYKNRLFVCSIKRWPLTSLHPFGTLIEELGVVGNRAALSNAIIKECLSIEETWGENALKCLPALPWSIPEREYEVRRDFRANRVFTIDPATAKDLDDALSITRLEGGLYEIGVHIADVSHFVKIGSALDREARKRGTSTYMVEKVIPMLPPQLCEELCSLVPHVERLAYSAVFTMNKDGRVIGTWLGRTIIKSCAQLAYEDAQTVIEGGHLPKNKLAESPFPASELEEDILTLQDLAQKMRTRRFENGALRIDNVKLSFKLDDDLMPTDAFVHESREANKLIEEFMLLANMTVAQQIAAGLPDLALLRRHEKPLERRLDGFVNRAKKMGYEVDTSSSGALFKSLNKIEDPGAKEVLESLVTNAMLRAKYFCTGMVDIAKYAHYALNVPLYTHFTSPIRRYADLMVHRQLDYVLADSDKFPVDREGMAKIAQQCNVKRDAAKLAQEQSDHLYLCLLIHDLTVRYGPVVRSATVIGVLDAAFDVLVPEFGVEKRVHVDQIPVSRSTYTEASNTLTLYWTKGVETIRWLAETSDDAHLQAIQGLADHHAGMEMASQSHTAEAALFDDEDDAELAEAKRKVYSGEDAAGSQQRTKSFRKTEIESEGAKVTADGHRIQEIRELQKLPVVITADMEKAPPIIKVFAQNPFAFDTE